MVLVRGLERSLTTIFLILCALRSLINDLMATRYTDSQGDIKTSLKLEHDMKMLEKS